MRRRTSLTRQQVQDWIDDALDVPMVLLSVLFLSLVIIELTVSLSPGTSRRVSLAQWAIWAVFAAEFVVRLVLAQDKWRHLRRHWLAALSVILPFLRMFRALRAIKALRALKLARLSALTGRSLRQLSRVLQVRGFGYVLLATALTTVFGAVGMYFVEHNAPDADIVTFGDALWWSAAAITTVASDLGPVTAEGRVIAITIYVYGMVVMGYIAATLASYFVRKEMHPQPEAGHTETALRETASEEADTTDLREKVDRMLALLEQRSQEGPRGQST